ncbi:hypothetical protein [Rubrimonas cliftonensis]|nr:hypothetical protein [Rubrimonas cliftonensis]
MACAQAPVAPAQAERAEALRMTATVDAIDRDARALTLRGEDGAVFEVLASPEVRNFDQIEVGDTVAVEYMRAVAARMATAEDGAPLSVTDAVRTAEGEKPGAGVAMGVEETLEVVAYDPATATAVVRDQAGETLRFVVAPEMRAFAEARKPGDRVRVTIIEAFALGVETVAK